MGYNNNKQGQEILNHWDQDGMPVSLSVSGDIEIGAVEIKNGTDDTRAVVGFANSAAVGGLALNVADANVKADLANLVGAVFTDDTAFTPATSKGIMIMAQADETGTDSVDEGDAGGLRMSLRRALKVDLDTTLAGEDQTNTVLAVVEKPLAVSTYCPDLDTSAALEASSVTKASAGVLYGFSASNTNATGHWIQFFNSTTLPADTTVPVLEFAIGGEGTTGQEWPKGRKFDTGIVWCISSTNGAKTIAGATVLADVNYK